MRILGAHFVKGKHWRGRFSRVKSSPSLMNRRVRHPACLGLLAVAALAATVRAQSDEVLIRDREGVALVKIGADAAHPEYPFQALASQTLLVLQEQAQKDGPKPLDLTIDARIQFIAERALRAVKRGAVVVIDPRNGDILAAASVPSFDPNKLTEETRKAWEADPTEPLLNRTIQSYAPGAAFLPVTGLAGVRAGLAEKSFTCTGSVTYGTKAMKCWIADKDESHGPLRLDEAMKVSCGAFFYQYGNAAGIEQIQTTGKLLGLGAVSGLPLAGESPGILPGPAWLRTIDPQMKWSDGHTANTSIGQGMVEASPLQMAMVAAAIGNGGKAYAPRLLAKDPPRLRADLLKEGFTKEGIEVVRHGMWKTVEDGTGNSGQRAKVPGIEVAGRTGTAQFWREETDESGKKTKVKDNHTWFIAFAPYKEPTLAICVLVQGAKSGGGVAAPIAGRILAKALASKTEPRVVPLAPAVGSFDRVEVVEP